MQRDYILREIERIGFILARLRDRILGRTTSMAEVKQELHAAAGSLGVDLELAHTVSPETLLALVSPTGDVEPGKCWFFAETFYLEGLDAYLTDRDDDALQLLQRARLLFDALRPAALHFFQLPEADERLAEIDRLLAELTV